MTAPIPFPRDLSGNRIGSNAAETASAASPPLAAEATLPRRWGDWSFSNGVISYMNRAVSYEEACDLHALFGERQRAASAAHDFAGATEAFVAASFAFCALCAADTHEITSRVLHLGGYEEPEQ